MIWQVTVGNPEMLTYIADFYASLSMPALVLTGSDLTVMAIGTLMLLGALRARGNV